MLPKSINLGFDNLLRGWKTLILLLLVSYAVGMLMRGSLCISVVVQGNIFCCQPNCHKEMLVVNVSVNNGYAFQHLFGTSGYF